MTLLACPGNALKVERMVSTHVDIEQAEWTSGTAFYGAAAIYEGKNIVQLNILSDRRQEGGGIP